MLLTLCIALAQQPLTPADEVVLTEIACVPLQAPCRKEGSIARGAEPDPDSLYLPTAVTIQPHGRVLASDWRDGSVHVFDERGERVALCIPPELRSNHPSHLTGGRDGRVLLEAGHFPRPPEPFEYVFAPDGAFLKQQPLPVDEDGLLVVIARYFSPLDDAVWSWRTDRSLTFARGENERRAWPLRPDGGPWRLGAGGFFSDGRSVVLDRYVPPPPSCFARPPRPAPDLRQLLFVFDAEGDFVEQIDLPEQPRIFWLAAGARRVVLEAADDEWILFDLDTHLMTSVRIPERTDTLPDERDTWNVVLRADGSEELWVVERKARRLLRYALPDSPPK